MHTLTLSSRLPKQRGFITYSMRFLEVSAWQLHELQAPCSALRVLYPPSYVHLVQHLEFSTWTQLQSIKPPYPEQSVRPQNIPDTYDTYRTTNKKTRFFLYRAPSARRPESVTVHHAHAETENPILKKEISPLRACVGRGFLPGQLLFLARSPLHRDRVAFFLHALSPILCMPKRRCSLLEFLDYK